MNVLDRYLVRAVLGVTALVMAVILALALLVTFLSEQHDTGVGHYTALEALWYCLLSLPQQAWELLPIGALIGALLGLGQLAAGSELTVMRAAGWSVARIAAAVLLAGLALVALELVLGEFLAPQLQQVARQQRAFDRLADASFSGGSAWVRDGRFILNVDQSADAQRPGGMLVFELSADHHLVAVGRAASAAGGGDHHWLLRDYAESRFGGPQVQASSVGVHQLDSNVSGEFLALAMSEPGQLAGGALWSLIRYDRANALDARPYLFAFWSRVARTTAIVFAVLLAIPFVLGPLRSSGAGVRLLIGLLLGIGFFFLQRLIESGTVVFNLNPVLLAWLPTSVLVVLTLALLARASSSAR